MVSAAPRAAAMFTCCQGVHILPRVMWPGQSNTRGAAAPALAAAAITLSFTSQPCSCMAWESTGMAGATNTAAGSTWYFSGTAVTCSTSSSWGGVMSMRQASTACYFVHDTQISGKTQGQWLTQPRLVLAGTTQAGQILHQ